MTFDQTMPIGEFLTATAAKQPTPGGGSVAALAGALAAAMGEMVVNYSIGKKDLLDNDATLRAVRDELTRARGVLLQLMLEDQEAYAALTEIRRTPVDSPDRATRVKDAVLTCIQVPLAIAASALAVLELCEKTVSIVNKFLLSDLATCADLAMATVRSALYSCRVNLNDVTNADDRRAIENTMSQVLSRGSMVIQRVSPRIWARHDRETKK